MAIAFGRLMRTSRRFRQLSIFLIVLALFFGNAVPAEAHYQVTTDRRALNNSGLLICDRNRMEHGWSYVQTDAENYAYSPCFDYNELSLPAGWVAVKAEWYHTNQYGQPASLCAWIDWKYSTDQNYQVNYSWNGQAVDLCGYPFVYTIDGYHYGWNWVAHRWDGGSARPSVWHTYA